jgi:dCMP deaminase
MKLSEVEAVERQRKWDLRFLAMAQLIAGWSKDPSTKTGAVIVDDHRIMLASGYNGFPPGIADTAERLNSREIKYELIVHCERNALANARQSVRGATLYTWPYFSCTPCAVLMLAAGIKRFVAPVCPDDKRDRWGATLDRARDLCWEAGAKVVLI